MMVDNTFLSWSFFAEYRILSWQLLPLPPLNFKDVFPHCLDCVVPLISMIFFLCLLLKFYFFWSKGIMKFLGMVFFVFIQFKVTDLTEFVD